MFCNRIGHTDTHCFKRDPSLKALRSIKVKTSQAAKESQMVQQIFIPKTVHSLSNPTKGIVNEFSEATQSKDRDVAADLIVSNSFQQHLEGDNLMDKECGSQLHDTETQHIEEDDIDEANKELVFFNSFQSLEHLSEEETALIDKIADKQSIAKSPSFSPYKSRIKPPSPRRRSMGADAIGIAAFLEQPTNKKSQPALVLQPRIVIALPLVDYSAHYRTSDLSKVIR